jgi:hypothetical protein
MADNAKRASDEAAVPASYRCTIDICHRCAVASCFECERFCCGRHLSSVSFLTASSSFCVRVCPDCLQHYWDDPEIQPLLSSVVTRFLVD